MGVPTTAEVSFRPLVVERNWSSVMLMILNEGKYFIIEMVLWSLRKRDALDRLWPWLARGLYAPRQ